MLAYHSPLVEPSPLRLGSWVLPAAAEAKLDGSGVGIMVERLFWSDLILHLITVAEIVRRETFGGFACECVMRTDWSQDKRLENWVGLKDDS